MPTVVIVSRTSGNAFSASSTCRTLPSVYSRLEPTGVLRRSDTKPWSDSGTNSVPISGTSAKLPTNVTVAIASTVFR